VRLRPYNRLEKLITRSKISFLKSKNLRYLVEYAMELLHSINAPNVLHLIVHLNVTRCIIKENAFRHSANNRLRRIWRLIKSLTRIRLSKCRKFFIKIWGEKIATRMELLRIPLLVSKINFVTLMVFLQVWFQMSVSKIFWQSWNLTRLRTLAWLRKKPGCSKRLSRRRIK